MKKLVLLSLIFSVFLIGCSSASPPEEEVVMEETITDFVPVETGKEVMHSPVTP